MITEEQQEIQRQALMQKFGLELLDMLASPVPEQFNVTLRFPQCRHCGRRPSLVERKRNPLMVQFRQHSKLAIAVPEYEILPCCNAAYDPKRTQTTVSNLQRRRMHEVAEKENAKKGTSTSVPA